MLTDPGKGLGRALGTMIGVMKFVEPEKVIEFTDGEEVELAGLRFVVDLAPGHTQGSVLLGIDVPGDDETRCASVSPATYSSGGRLAGRTCREAITSSFGPRSPPKLLPLPDDTVVLPGHGPQTTIGAERCRQPIPRRHRRIGALGAPERTTRTVSEFQARAASRIISHRVRPTSPASGTPSRRLPHLAGYGHIELPIFEDTALFARGVGSRPTSSPGEMYTFADRGERSVTPRRARPV